MIMMVAMMIMMVAMMMLMMMLMMMTMMMMMMMMKGPWLYFFLLVHVYAYKLYHLFGRFINIHNLSI